MHKVIDHEDASVGEITKATTFSNGVTILGVTAPRGDEVSFKLIGVETYGAKGVSKNIEGDDYAEILAIAKKACEDMTTVFERLNKCISNQ